MQQFVSDYMEGAAPEILDALTRTNMEKTAGYGRDPYCESARERIRRACNAPEAEVHFLVGGTQTRDHHLIAAPALAGRPRSRKWTRRRA